MPASSLPRTDLDSRLHAIEQGDLISFGAISLSVRPGSTLAQAAHPDDVVRTATTGPTEVVTLSFETASGWYAVLTQDCDIVRSVADEPCLAVAPVIHIPAEDWLALHHGLTSYKRFALPPDQVPPLDDAHRERVPAGHRPVVDIRYISSIDKTALREGFEHLHPLVGHDKLRFQQWVGARFGRESFADPVHTSVLPAAREALTMALARGNRGLATAPEKFVASVSEYWVRSTDRYVEVMGRLDAQRGRAAGTLRRKDGSSTWNSDLLTQGCQALSSSANQVMRGSGYTVKFVPGDFNDLSAAEFETYALWHVTDEPAAP